jgi:hypothetical protein
VLEHLGHWHNRSERLQDLRAEAEAVQAGIDYLNNRAVLLKRANSWITS